MLILIRLLTIYWVRLVTDRNNNFDFLRLLAALLVVFFHSFAVAGRKDMALFGYFGVSAFFVISGYLVTQSWYNEPNAGRFLWKRFLRIIPGLLGVAAFTVLVIGPLNTTLPLTDYFTSIATWAYISIATVYYMAWTLPGVFTANPAPFVVNGSLWTIPVEFNLYILLAIFGALGLVYKKKFMLALVALSALFYADAMLPGVVFLHHFAELAVKVGIVGFIDHLVLLDPISYPTFFLIGSLYYLYREKIAFYPWPALCGLIACVLTWGTPAFYLLLFTAFPYSILSIAFTPVKALRDIGRHGDFSYGVYIYAFPIQQTVVAYFPGISPMGVFLIATPAIFIVAFLSWHLIESKALALKRIDPLLFIRRVVRRHAGKRAMPVEVMQTMARK